MLRFSTQKDFDQFLEKRSLNSKKKGLKAFDTSDKTKPQISPHALSMAALAKNPDLAKGKGEHYDQVRIFDYLERHWPEIYDLFHATPNGGLRHKATAGQMKAEGQKSGYPDMTLDAARGVYHGLRIELKFGKNTASDDQLLWQVRLNKQGYCALILNGWEIVVEAILAYWALASGEVLNEIFFDTKTMISVLDNQLMRDVKHGK
jgi:hypothetical protein